MKEPKEQYKPAERLELKELKTKVFKQVCCPSCDIEIISGNLNLQNSVAKCDSCNVIFSIEEEVEGVKMKQEMRQEVLRPEGIDLFFYKDDLDITVQKHIQGLDAFGIALLPMIALFSIGAFFLAENPISPFIPIVLSIGALYYISKWFNYSEKNKTHIDVNDKFLSIKSRPKNLKKDKQYAASDIDQLYLKHAADGSGFTIHLIVNGLEGQKHEKLLTVNTISKAKYLEQEIERYLNIEDRKVPEATA